MTIAKILSGKGAAIMSISPEESLQAAAALLTTRRVGALVALDVSGKLVGILSERDIVRICAEQGQTAMSTSVGAAMTRDVLTGAKTESIVPWPG